jgi:hypothetical protein
VSVALLTGVALRLVHTSMSAATACSGEPPKKVRANELGADRLAFARETTGRRRGLQP